MKIAKPVQKSPTVVTPLYQQLLVLIPLLKVMEESRPLINNRNRPFRLEAVHLPSGKLSIGLTEANSVDTNGDNPETTITIHSTTENSTPLCYQSTFLLVWTYLCNISTMTDTEQKAMHERFKLAWGVYVFGHEQEIKEMGLA
jgi:hypothetical protein